MLSTLKPKAALGQSLEHIPKFLARPGGLVKSYDRANLRPDLMAGLTVAVIALPQALAFALVARLPPQMGIYAAIVGGLIGALWGSSNQNHTGPANAISLLVLSSLGTSFEPESAEFILAAGILAMMVGALQLVLGLARMGVLVNFVSHSVIVGFSSGAGLLIAVRQTEPLLGLSFESHNLYESIIGLVSNFQDAFLPAAIIGIGSAILVIVLGKVNSRLPAALITLIAASIAVVAFGLDESELDVIGDLPTGLPPITDLSLFNIGFLSRLSTGALAVAAIGLVETTAISRSIATQTSQRLDSNQEFVGQGLANIAVGLFSGFPIAGSFTRSAVNFSAGARTPLAAAFSSVFVLAGIFLMRPLIAYLPNAALAGVLIVIAYRMINREEIARIWQGAQADAVIMLVTFLGTLFLDLAFAVLLGILLSFGLYILRTSVPRVHEVQPDQEYRHLDYRPGTASCPQLGILDILGDLYFGAVNHVEEAIHIYAEKHKEQRYLLLRLNRVNHCDFSGIHMLESVVHAYRERGGDVFMTRVGYRVNKIMESTGFDQVIGEENFLSDDDAISHLFYHVLDPAICIYECPYRIFRECQNLPKQLYSDPMRVHDDTYAVPEPKEIPAKVLWDELKTHSTSLTIIDVREPREYYRGHIPGAMLVPLPKLLRGEHMLAVAGMHRVVFVCRSGRRSRRAAHWVAEDGIKAEILQGGMLAWEAADLLEAVPTGTPVQQSNVER